MFRLRVGYLIGGIATGLVLLFSFLATLPDGKLHIFFCDVGQGDGAYIRFADGRDMVVDGGPDDKILGCLGRHMPFWDRHINLVVMTHPQKDHFMGLVSVLDRYGVDYFVRSDVNNNTESYAKLLEVVKRRNVPVKFITRGEHIDVGPSSLSLLWPSSEQIAKGKTIRAPLAGLQGVPLQKNVLGSSVVGDLNDYCLVFFLRYGSFDALFTGDADSRVEQNYVGAKLADDTLEVLKVPHHGSRTGMTEEFVQWLHPKLAVISVGKNTYGHPSPESIKKLVDVGSRVLRTDQEGDIEVVSDGRGWEVKTGKLYTTP
ncbi:hypothetical protein HY086_05020 [Candidatus Gottesmanbacteria bacterium]|nr:hypothetical protein [Candidatus Gottesmanbacteria bacterium]